MDKLTTYRELIKSLLAKCVALDNQQPTPGVEHLLITDDAQGHYLWLNVGWWQRERLNTMTAYLRLKDGKIYIEEDMTEFGVANELLAAGVPQSDIVLAFQHPQERVLTEFAAA